MHEDDLSGRLIEQMKAGKDKWEIVELPAIAVGVDRDGHKIIDPIGRMPGEALWPAEYDLPRLNRRRDNTLARYFSAMYQQQPVPDEGELFAPDKLTLRDHTGDIFQRVRGWDLAGTVEGDWTCGALIGKTKAGKFVVIDVRRMRGTPDKVLAFIKETAMAETRMTRISLPEDPGQAGIFQAQSMVKALAGYTVVSSKETGDKETRAEPYAVQVNINPGNEEVLIGTFPHTFRDVPGNGTEHTSLDVFRLVPHLTLHTCGSQMPMLAAALSASVALWKALRLARASSDVLTPIW
jgi:predicted phage terminase large subunit-like protein